MNFWSIIKAITSLWKMIDLILDTWRKFQTAREEQKSKKVKEERDKIVRQVEAETQKQPGERDREKLKDLHRRLRKLGNR